MTSSTPMTSNEPVLNYLPGSPERALLRADLEAQKNICREIPCIVGGERIFGSSNAVVRAPHEHERVLANVYHADQHTVQAAIDAALAAQREWASWSLQERSAVFLKAADLLAGPWRARLNAATMLGQSKTVVQAEIDSACELIDFLRFNVQFANDIAANQPMSSSGVRNAMEYRPLEGFVYAVTPFNFTAIGGNLAVADG